MNKKIRYSLFLIIITLILCIFASCAGKGEGESNGSDSLDTSNSTEGSAEHTHEWSEWATLEAPTCTVKGKAKRECACGKTEEKVLYTLRHSSKEWIIDKEPTLRLAGEKHQTCDGCGLIINQTQIAPLTVNLLDGFIDTVQEEYRPYYNLGHNRNLSGKPVVVLLFLDDDESSWSKEEVEAFTSNQALVALDYLEESASAYGVELDFTVESYSSATSGYQMKYEGIVNPDLNNGGSTKDTIDKAAQDIGCKTNWGLYSYYKEKYPEEDIIFLAILNKAGVSYTRNLIGAGYVDYAEHSVIFANTLEAEDTTLEDGERSASIAFHILQLFGAQKLYTSVEREIIATFTYPNDIMLGVSNDINNHTIGDCTAYSVGWTNVVPEVCKLEEWWK